MTESESEEKCPEEKLVANVAKDVPQGTDVEPTFLQSVLDGLPPK
jgi:hypothetical protein